MGRDLACGVIALAIAGAYYAMASALPHSLLSDDVGADGVPKALAAALAALGALQIARCALRRPAADGATAEIGGIARHARALGLIAAGAIYIALTPYLGYPVSTAALICGVALYAGMAPSLRLAAVGAAGGAVFWVMFVKLLGVAMPVGLFARLHG